MRVPSSEQLATLQERYGEAQRHYHTWQHIEALLGHFKTIADQLNDPDSILWALYWHDAIYDPQASDNEDKSADLLLEMATDDLPAASLARADRIIRATKQHLVPTGLATEDQADLELFLDIDLSILAAAPAVFDAYETHIRREYAFVPEPVYVQARRAILQTFLKRDRLYFSDFFFAQWEAQARRNLSRSIEQLTKQEREHD
jgi:predicted metal-dependent HD superfamily phosphohydrolase